MVYYKQVPVLVDIVHNNYLLQKLCEHASHNSPGNAQGLAVFQNQNTHPWPKQGKESILLQSSGFVQVAQCILQGGM